MTKEATANLLLPLVACELELHVVFLNMALPQTVGGLFLLTEDRLLLPSDLRRGGMHYGYI